MEISTYELIRHAVNQRIEVLWAQDNAVLRTMSLDQAKQLVWDAARSVRRDPCVCSAKMPS